MICIIPSLLCSMIFFPPPPPPPPSKGREMCRRSIGRGALFILRQWQEIERSSSPMRASLGAQRQWIILVCHFHHEGARNILLPNLDSVVIVTRNVSRLSEIGPCECLGLCSEWMGLVYVSARTCRSTDPGTHVEQTRLDRVGSYTTPSRTGIKHFSNVILCQESDHSLSFSICIIIYCKPLLTIILRISYI